MKGAILSFFLLFGLYLWLVYYITHAPGSILLCGGGSLPFKGIEQIKKSSRSDNCLVITTSTQPNKRWQEYFSKVEFVFPKDVTKELLNKYKLIAICGGDQWVYLNELDGKLIEQAYKNGTCIIATSAGSAILGEFYFTAEDGTINSAEAMADKHVTISKGFCEIEYLKNTFVETHYSQREREDRLKAFMDKCGAKYGIGIDEATALYVSCFNNRIVYGSGSVSMITKGE